MTGRPASYPWQADTWRRMVSLVESDRLPHGLLLAGSSEIGKGDFADRLARLLLCMAPVGGEPCRNCRACTLYEAATHPDFLHIEPPPPGKVIKVDQIRELGEFLSHTASAGPRRVIIVNPAEAMNLNAANAFLKTLEEPGRDVILILVSHQMSSLLPTIRSRCRIIPFPVPEWGEVEAWLRSPGRDPEAVRQAMVLAGGRPLRALRLLDSELRDQLDQFGTALAQLAENRLPPLEAAKEIQGLDSRDALEWFQYHVYQMIRSLADDDGARSRILFRFLDRLSVARQRLLSTANPQPQLLWEEILMDWKSVLDLAGKPERTEG